MPSLPGLQFGSGYLLASPQADAGNPAPNPTPTIVGVLQNVKFTIAGDIKTLFGQNQWPVDSAVGKRTISGTFDFAQLSNQLLSQLFTGDAVAEGVVDTVINEVSAIPATTPFTVTVDHAADFLQDFGVIFSATGIPLERLPTGTPATGQYVVNETTGVYTFATADASLGVFISYTYTNSASGTTLVATNQPMGFGPILALNVAFLYEGGGMGFFFPNVRLGKIDIATKIDDYTMYTADFQAFAGAAGQPFQSYNLF